MKTSSEIKNYLEYGRLLMIGKAVIAFGQLSIILFTPLTYLQDQVAGVDAYKQCENFYSNWNILCSTSLSD